MNSMERIGALLSGSPVDRPPYTMTLSLYGARLLGVSTQSYYTDPDLYAQGQQAVIDLCAPDIVFSPFALSLEVAPYGVLLNFPENGPPYLKKPAFRSIRDFSIKKAPAIDDSPELSYLIRATEKLATLQKGSRPVAAPILAPVDIPILLIGIDAWLEVLLFKPEDAKTVSEIALEHFINLAKAYAKAGAAFLVTPVMFANTALVNPEISREILIPLLKEGFSHLDIPIVFHHGGNRLADTIELYRDIPNLLGFVLDERDSFDEARKRIGPDFILMGNLNGPYMPFRSTSDIIETTKKLLENRKTDRKFVFATSGADIPFDTEPDTLAALRDVFVSPSGVSENA